MLKNILAVIAGVIAAVIVIFIVEAISNMLFPPASKIDMENPEEVRKMIENAPAGALIVVIIGWAIGSFAGGLVATIISNKNKSTYALIVGTLLMISGIINLMMFTHPIWMWIFGLGVNLPFAYLGYRFVSKRTISQPV